MKKIYIVLLMGLMIFALAGCTEDPIYYDIQFDANGGTETSSITVLEGTSVVEPEQPFKEGYKFDGWFVDGEWQTPYDFSSPVDGALSLKAVWEIIETYDVIYLDIEGDILQMDNYELNDLIPTSSIPQDLEAEGHTFLGWYTDEDFTSEFDFSLPIEDDIILYSKWEVHQFIIEYIDYNTEIVLTIDVDYGTRLNMLQYPYTLNKAGYIPVGWYLDEDLTIPFRTSTMPSEDVTAYAKWEKLPYFNYLNETNPHVFIKVKDLGIIELELFPNVAPISVDNFIAYIQNNDYTNNEFHRVIEGFMIQGGGFSNTECPITGEFPSNGIMNTLSHYRGVLSMARTSVKNSATGQFFIVHEDSLFLDPNYATFGALISGFDILDYIADVNTNIYDAPYNPIIIESITVSLNGYEPQPRVCAE